MEGKKRLENKDDSITSEYLNLLLDAVLSGSSGGKKLDKYFEMYYKKESDTIQFEDLWTI